MGNNNRFLMDLIRFNIHFFKLLLNIVWYMSYSSCQSTDDAIENIHRECYELLFSNTEIYEALLNLDKASDSCNPLTIEAKQDNRKEIDQLEEMQYPHCSNFTIPPVSLKCPLDIFDGFDSGSTVVENRKRKPSSNSIDVFNSTYKLDSDFLFGTNESNKKSKININEEEILQIENKCLGETTFSETVIVNTNNSLNIPTECESSTFLNDSQTTCNVKNYILETQENVCKLQVEINTGGITQIDLPEKCQKFVSEEQIVLSSTNTEFIENKKHNIKDYKHIKVSATEVKFSYSLEDVAFIPHTRYGNYIISPNGNLLYDNKITIDYRKKESDGLEEIKYTKNDEVLLNFHRLEITLSNNFKDDKKFEITCVINNIPRYFRPIFSKKPYMIENSFQSISRQCAFMYKVYISFTFSCEDKVKLMDLLPYLAYVDYQKIWKDYYVITILNWRYKTTMTRSSTNQLNNKFSKDINNFTEEKYKFKTIRSVLGIKNFRFRRYIERNFPVNLIIKEMLNKLSIMHRHLVYLNDLVYTPDQLKTVINEIENVSKQFLNGILQIEKGSILNDTENEIVSVYETIYLNFEKLSCSIIYSYKIYFNLNN